MFSWFTKKIKKQIQINDFSKIGVDIHSHLIPALDDGAKSLNDSIEIIINLKKRGYDKLITTPHIMSDFYDNSEEKILKGLKSIRNELKAKAIDIKIDAAAEYFVDYEFQQRVLRNDKFLTISKKYILIEFSFVAKPLNYLESIFQLQLNGYKVILAHPERYMYFSEDDLLNLNNKGVYFQLNMLSSVGYYSKDVKKKADWLIKNNLITFLGTDCHNMGQLRFLDMCKYDSNLINLINNSLLRNNEFI